MSSLTLSAVNLLWLEQVGGGNCLMMLLRGQVGMPQEIVRDGWIYDFPGAISLPDPLLFFYFLVEVNLLE